MEEKEGKTQEVSESPSAGPAETKETRNKEGAQEIQEVAALPDEEMAREGDRDGQPPATGKATDGDDNRAADDDSAQTAEVPDNGEKEPASSKDAATQSAGGPQAQRHFPGELPGSFEEVLTRIPRRNPLGFLLVVCVLQPVLGALPHDVKAELEARIDKPLCFNAARATGLNILCNMILYPVVLMVLAAMVRGVDILFSQNINVFILTGIFLGLVEGGYRLRDGIFHVKPEEEVVLRGAFYGMPMVGLVHGFVSRNSGLLRQLPIPIEGFYDKGFVEKLERERRYGQAYTLEDLGDAYHLRMEFPRLTPDIGLAGRTDLPREMPDYAYELELKDGHFIVKGRCVDERVRKVTGNVGAFPSGFTTVIPLGERVQGYSYHYDDKILQVILLKEQGAQRRAA